MTTTLVYALVALVLGALGHFLVSKTSPFNRKGAREYEQNLRRRTIGQVLYTFSGILFGVTAIQLYLYFTSPSAAPPTDFPTTAYVPPKLPPPPPPEPEPERRPPSVTLDQPKPDAPDPLETKDVPLTAPDIPKMSPFEAPATPADETASATGQDPVWKPKMPDPEAAPPMSKEDQAKFDAGLAAANAAIAKDPANSQAYESRGDIYASLKKLSLAEKDYQAAIDADSKNFPARVALAQVHFYQRNFDKARGEFEALKGMGNAENTDYAAYQIFLCDIAANHLDAAKHALDTFNDAGDNPSYYFANVAWDLRQKKFDDGHDWLASAQRIYDVKKFTLYARSLVTLGYLNEQPTN